MEIGPDAGQKEVLKMKLFIDSGNLKEIEALMPLGIIDGITTNPSLLAKEPGDYKEILKKICQIVQGPTSAEVVATDYEGMVKEGRELAAIDEHIVVKYYEDSNEAKLYDIVNGVGANSISLGP